MGQMDGKVAVIAGGATGIGAATARLIAAEGGAVVVGDLNDTAAKELVAGLAGPMGPGLSVRTDVSVEADVEALMEAAVQAYGRLDLVMNNAAPLHLAPLDGGAEDIDVEVWDETFAVIARGAFLGCKHAIPRLRASGGGSIVNTSSASGLAGSLAGHAYGAAKAAVNLLTMSVAARYGPEGIRCNAIAPGLVITTQEKMPLAIRDRIAADFLTITPAPRVGVPEDIARAVLFFAADAAGYLNGQVLSIDGGMAAQGPWSQVQAKMLGEQGA